MYIIMYSCIYILVDLKQGCIYGGGGGEGKEIERKRKKMMLWGGGLPLNIFLGLIFFRVWLRNFQGGG